MLTTGDLCRAFVERQLRSFRDAEHCTIVTLVKPGRRLVILEYTVNEAGIGRVGPVLDPARALVAAGGDLWAAFHNHNFFFDGGRWHGGGVAPSAPDVELTAALSDELGLEEVWITNGFSTLVLPTSELVEVGRTDASQSGRSAR